jgi:hypothetical protein
MTTELQPDPVAEEQPEQTEGSRLRQERNEAVAEAKNLRSELVGTHLEKIGLSPEEGLGIAIKEAFEGKPTLEEVTSFASERYKYVPPDVPVEPAQVTEPATRIEQVQDGSTPVVPPPDVDPVTEAEQKLIDPEATRADGQESVAVKMARYQQVRHTLQT